MLSQQDCSLAINLGLRADAGSKHCQAATVGSLSVSCIVSLRFFFSTFDLTHL
jgi:hypothetical protein